MTSGRFETNVAGVTHDNDNGTSRQAIIRLIKNDEKLILKHQAVEQDANAVKVFRQNGDQVGYLSRELAAEIAPILDSGKIVKAEVVKKERFASTDGKTKWGLRIQLTKPGYKNPISIGCGIIVGIGIILLIIVIVWMLRL